MPLRLPAGKRLAVNVGVDFDVMCASGGFATPRDIYDCRSDN